MTWRLGVVQEGAVQEADAVGFEMGAEEEGRGASICSRSISITNRSGRCRYPSVILDDSFCRALDRSPSALRHKALLLAGLLPTTSPQP